MVGSICGSGLGWGAWFWGSLWLPTRRWWLWGPGWSVVWSAWPPGCHSGERLGGLWLTIWGACRERKRARSQKAALPNQPRCQVLLPKNLQPQGSNLERPGPSGKPTQVKVLCVHISSLPHTRHHPQADLDLFYRVSSLASPLDPGGSETPEHLQRQEHSSGTAPCSSGYQVVISGDAASAHQRGCQCGHRALIFRTSPQETSPLQASGVGPG